VCVCVDVSARWSRLTMKWLMSTLATARRVSPRRRHRQHCHSTGTLLHLLQPLEVCCFDLVPCCYQIASYESHILLLSSLSSFIVTPTPTSHIYDKLRVRVHQCAALGSTVLPTISRITCYTLPHVRPSIHPVLTVKWHWKPYNVQA